MRVVSKAPGASLFFTMACLFVLLSTSPLGARGDTPCTYTPTTPPSSFPFSLPRDLGLHPDTQYETIWYIGVVRTLDGRRAFGVEYMIARSVVTCASPNSTSESAIAWIAVADTAVGVFRQQALIGSVQSNDVTNASAPFSLSSGLVGVWQRTAADTQFCGAADASWTKQRLAGVGNDDRAHDWFGYDLCVDVGDGGITPDTQAMGNNGLCVLRREPPLPDVSIWHMEQVKVAARGTVSVGGETLDVAGALWYQHMWGSPVAPGSGPQPLSSWDWAYMKLSDGYSLQLVRFAAFLASSYLNLIDPQGGNRFVPSAEWTYVGSEPWTSGNATFFMRHDLDVPSLNLSLTVHTLQNDNLLRADGYPLFYEGASTCKGVHGGVAVTGDAYTEHLIGQ